MPSVKNLVTVACVNFKPAGGDKERALERILHFINQAGRKEANIILFPELALTSMPRDELIPRFAETIPGPSTEKIAQLAAQLNVYVIIGMLERDQNYTSRVYNAAAVIGPSGVLGSYRKTHPFHPFENYERGRQFPLFETPYGPIGVGICYDTYCFPEVCRQYAARGVRLYCNLTAVPCGLQCSDEADLYMTMLKARSIENQLFIATAGLVGKETIEQLGEVTFLGLSVIVGPKDGYSSCQVYAGPGDQVKEEIIMAQLDLSIKSSSPLVANILSHRHPEIYVDFAGSPASKQDKN
jgi:predicted amidohydrolase